MFSFPYSCSRKYACCFRGSEDSQDELQAETEEIPEWPVVPAGTPVSDFAALRSRTGDAGVFSALAKAMARRALEEAVQEIWDADVLGVEVGGGEFAPRGEGNGDLGGVGESGDCAPSDLTDPAQPLLQLPLRRSRAQNVLRLTRILGSLDLTISCLEKYNAVGFSHRLRRRFRGVLRTVEDASPGLMMGQALVRKGV